MYVTGFNHVCYCRLAVHYFKRCLFLYSSLAGGGTLAVLSCILHCVVESLHPRCYSSLAGGGTLAVLSGMLHCAVESLHPRCYSSLAGGGTLAVLSCMLHCVVESLHPRCYSSLAGGGHSSCPLRYATLCSRVIAPPLLQLLG